MNKLSLKRFLQLLGAVAGVVFLVTTGLALAYGYQARQGNASDWELLAAISDYSATVVSGVIALLSWLSSRFAPAAASPPAAVHSTHIGSVGGNFTNTGMIAGRDLIVNADPNAPLTFPLHWLPTANPYFTGRELLLARLAVGEGAVAITQAIAGMGGVGKTQLALAYAHPPAARPV